MKQRFLLLIIAIVLSGVAYGCHGVSRGYVEMEYGYPPPPYYWRGYYNYYYPYYPYYPYPSPYYYSVPRAEEKGREFKSDDGSTPAPSAPSPGGGRRFKK